MMYTFDDALEGDSGYVKTFAKKRAAVQDVFMMKNMMYTFDDALEGDSGLC